MGFHDLYRALEFGDPGERQRATTLVSALAPPSALRPLLRAYLAHGDRDQLAALARFGSKLTPLVGRLLDDPVLSGSQRARLMNVLGVSDDAAAAPIARSGRRDYEPTARVAAAAALARLGEADGVGWLDDSLHATDPVERLHALRAVGELDDPRLAPVAARHVERYLAAGGAVPRRVIVSLPMLYDPRGQLPDLVARHVAESPRRLTIVIGPEAAPLAESHRDALARALPDHRLFFTTCRHAPAEQFELLARARDAAAADSRSRVALIGVLPSPGGLIPPPHFLVRGEGGGYSARIVFVGQQDFNVVMEWWYYIDDRSEVPTDFEVVLTALTLGGDRMTEEEWLTYRLADPWQRERFGRALLAHRATVGDALDGRSWLF